MLGLNEGQLFQEIDSGVFGIGHIAMHIDDQPTLKPHDILQLLATGVARAIDANNRAIENQLRSAGIKL